MGWAGKTANLFEYALLLSAVLFTFSRGTGFVRIVNYSTVSYHEISSGIQGFSGWNPSFRPLSQGYGEGHEGIREEMRIGKVFKLTGRENVNDLPPVR